MSTMIRVTSYICLVLLMLSIQQCCTTGRKISPFAYLDLPSHEQFSNEFHQSIRRALLRIEFLPASSLRTVQETLREAIANELTSPMDKEIYKVMLNLSETSDECPNDLINVYLSVWAQMMANFGHGWGKFYTYMRIFGEQRFKLCAKRANGEFNESMTVGDWAITMNEFNQVFRATFDLEDGESSQNSFVSLYDKLRQVDMTTDQFDARRMFHAIEAIENSTAGASGAPISPSNPMNEMNGDNFSRVRNFIVSRCERFDGTKPLSEILSLVGLARCFSSEPVNYDPRLLLLEEYRRLCLAWTRPGSRNSVENNVRKQLQASTS